MLRAKKPEAITKRLKMFVFGEPGTGKTTAACQFPAAYIIDCERGAENYDKLIKASNSVLWQSNDMDEITKELKALASEKHEYRTLVLDPITTLESDLIGRLQKKYPGKNDEGGDMRVWGERDREMRRLTNLLLGLDMNVIVTAHSKTDYGPNMTKLGNIHDGWKRLPYMFDLVIELQRRGEKRVGLIRKTRLEAFKDAETFDFSYAEIVKRAGDSIERAAVPVVPATQEQVDQLKQLLGVWKHEPEVEEKMLAKANAETFADMSGKQIGECIAYIQKELAKATK